MSPLQLVPKRWFPLKDGNQGTTPTRLTLHYVGSVVVREWLVPSVPNWFPSSGTTCNPQRSTLMTSTASLARRIAKLERQVRQPLVIVLRHFTAEPTGIVGAGRQWHRAAGEPLEALRARARADVLAAKGVPAVVVLRECAMAGAEPQHVGA